MKIMFISLGCDKNLVDSELMMGLLRDKGYEFTADINEAEVAIINTCGFINDAKEESINTILSVAEYKKQKLSALIVTGCLSQRYNESILEQMPEIDAIVGTTAFDSIADVLSEVLNGKKNIKKLEDISRLCHPKTERVISTGGYYAYLKIADGCDKRCTYCSIPNIRGRYRSVPMEELIEEARTLSEEGVCELLLVAQETTLYGKDIYGEKSLPKLISKLSEIEGIKWIRILYCYPEEIDDELIETIKNNPKVCHYIDMPVQHCNDRILKLMGRRTNKKELTEIIQKIRREIPDICLRTTLICGFPSETEEEHEELLDFMDETEFDRLGAFAYSPEEDTVAATMEGQIEDEEKQNRVDNVMELQQEISADKSREMIGKELTVIVEGLATGEGENVYVARSYKDAPDVDGYVFFNSEEEIISGSFARVRIEKATEYDLMGVLL